MEPLSVLVSLTFILTTGLAVGLLYHAAHRSKRLLWLLLAWLLVQGGLAGSGFYAVTNTVPPRLALALMPALLAIAGLAGTARGRCFMAGLRLDSLTLLHVVRIPVELVLFGLFVQGAVPQLMTFEGRNWDILVGLTTPVVYCLALRKNVLGTKSLLLWNIVGLASLLNIVTTALLAAPTPFQRFAFDQPNVAVLYFPFVWLPACVVPIVLLAHLVAIWRLAAKPVAVPYVAVASPAG